MRRRKRPKSFRELAEEGALGRRLRRLQEEAGLGDAPSPEDEEARLFLRLFGNCDDFVRLERISHEADTFDAPFDDDEADADKMPFDVEGAVQRWRREIAWAQRQLGLLPDDEMPGPAADVEQPQQ
jgi:hypothetical protein